MKRLLTFITCTLILGCSQESDDQKVFTGDNHISPVSNFEIVEKIVSGTTRDTTKIYAEAGVNYQIESAVTVPDVKIYHKVINPEGVRVSLNNNFFAVDTAESLSVISYAVTNSAEDFKYIVRVKAYREVQEEFQGVWYLKKETHKNLIGTSEYEYEESGLWKLIEITGDSVISYRGDSNGESSLFLFSPFMTMDMTRDGEDIIYTEASEYGSVSYRYSPYSGSVADAPWIEQSYVIPENFLGAWYLSGQNIENTKIIDSVKFDTASEVSAGSIEEADTLLYFTADSLYCYVDTDSGSDLILAGKADYSRLFHNGKGDSKTLTFEEHSYGENMNSIEMNSVLSNYTKFQGSVPPMEWRDSVFTTPSYATDLAPGDDDSSILRTKNSGCWFRVAVEEGKSYRFISSSGDPKFTVQEKVYSNYDGLITTGTSGVTFTAKETTYYYLRAQLIGGAYGAVWSRFYELSE